MFKYLIIICLICVINTTGFIYRDDSLRNSRQTNQQYKKLDTIQRNIEVRGGKYIPPTTDEILSKNVLEIAKKLLTLSTKYSNSNVKYQVFSPIGISNVLSLLALGAKKMTEHELNCALGFNQIPEFYVNPLKVHEKFGQLIEQLKDDNKSQLQLKKIKRSPLIQSLKSHPTKSPQIDSFLSSIPNQYRNLKNYHIFRRSTKSSSSSGGGGGGAIKFPDNSESLESIRTKINYDKLLKMNPTTNQQINLQNRQHDNENESLLSTKNLNDHEIDIANGIFIQNDYELKSNYENSIKKIYRYNTDIKMLDFENDSETARQYINEWGKLKTHGKIKNLIQDNLDEQTNMIITSALYYRSIWQQSFIENYTMKKPFYPNGKDEKYILVDMMTNGGEFLYYDAVEYECHFLGLPFKDNLSIMYIIMPYDSNKEKLHKIQELLTSERIDNIISNRMQKRQILLNLPRMNLESSINLREILLQMGIKTLFNSIESDLSGIISKKYTSKSIENNKFTLTNTKDESILLKKIQNIKSTLLPQKNDEIIEIKKTNRNNQPFLFEDDLKLITNRYNEYKSDRSTAAASSTNRHHFNHGPTIRINNSRYNWYENKKIHKRNIGRMSLSPSSSSSSSSSSYDNNGMDKKQDKINDHDHYNFGNNGNYEVKGEDIQNEDYKKLFVDNIVHKINLKINEQGIEGVATTVTHLTRNDFDYEFSIDGPFLFLIRHEKTKLPIFYGSIYDPSI